MIHFVLTLAVALARVLFGSRLELLAENLALRQQLAVFKHKRPRPRMGPGDRMFWVFLRRVWRHWANALIVVEPDTVVGWQRQGFKWFWRWISRAKRVGRPRFGGTLRRELLNQIIVFNQTQLHRVVNARSDPPE